MGRRSFLCQREGESCGRGWLRVWFRHRPEEERIFDEGFTQVKVRTNGSTCSIVIPLDCDWLTNIESIVPSLVPLCYGAEKRNLRSLKDVDLSLGIS